MSRTHLDHTDTSGMVHFLKRRHTDAFDVVDDPTMSIHEKREMLADWASDRRAVVNHPALRRLDSGELVDIDVILDALKRLDDMKSDAIWHCQSQRQADRSKTRKTWSFRKNDDDDDPPPTPVAATPWRPRPILDATRGLMVA